MDEQAALIFGSLVGAGVASFGVVGAIGWQIYKAVQRLVPKVNGLADGVDEALGVPTKIDPHDLETPDPVRRRNTGAFQVMIREELSLHDHRFDRRFDRLEEQVETMADNLTELHKTQLGQADLLARLANRQDQVVARTAEHSAELALARSGDSMTAGRVTQLGAGRTGK